METKYEVIPIFPTALYVNEIPKQLIQDHIFFLDQEEIINKDANEFGGRSKNSYLFSKNEYQNLSKYILQHATHYSENYLNYDYQHYKFSQSWVSVKYPNQEHFPHSHGHSLISGIVFYKEENENVSDVEFFKDDKIYGSHKTKLTTNSFNYTSYTVKYTPNLLVLFPSNLIHSVSKNITDTPRKSLAFNVVPRDSFGSEEKLTELKFN